MMRYSTFLIALLLSIRLAAFDVVVNVQHATCGGATGSAWAYAVGGVGTYSYLWSNGVTTPNLGSVPPGMYILTVTDSEANEVVVDVEIIATSALFPPVIPAGPVWSCDASCSGSFYQYVPLSGASPYTVVFDPPGPTGGASPNGIYFNNLCPGTIYTATVTDANGCAGVVGPIEVVGDMAPQVVSSTTTGSCPAGATGSLSVTFNVVDSVIVSGPSGLVNVPTANPLNISNLAPGDYTILAYHFGGPGTSSPGTNGSCSSETTITVPISSGPCGSITGLLYADLDSDCDQDATDPGMPHRVLTIAPGGHFVLTDASGAYHTELFYDSYSLNTSPDGYAPVCPALPAPFTLDAASPTATIDVAMAPLFGPDASAFLSMGVHRPGFAVHYHVQASNEGPYAFPGSTLHLHFDPLLIIADNGGGMLAGPGHLEWDLGELAPYSQASFTIEFTVPANTGLIGTQVIGTATLETDFPDADPDNNTYTVTRTIIGAYDPNDKLVQTSSRSSEQHFFLDQDQWVDYTIRFQNTGTAEAIHVYLLDTIAPELDLATLQILGASHDFEASLRPGRVLRFDFPGIMLPDSASDQAGSQGFASFRLRPAPGLVPGEQLVNAADIFFDLNEPIRTNDAVLTAEFSTGIAAEAMGTVNVFPNPADDALHVRLPDGRWDVTVIAMDGRVVDTRRMNGDLLTLDTSALARGSYLLHLNGQQGQVLHARFARH